MSNVIYVQFGQDKRLKKERMRVQFKILYCEYKIFKPFFDASCEAIGEINQVTECFEIYNQLVDSPNFNEIHLDQLDQLNDFCEKVRCLITQIKKTIGG
jgi:hypothetical protein